MFTLLRNYRTMFMLTVCKSFEGDVAKFNTTDDDQLDASETQALLESSEAKEIVGLAEVDTLESAVDLAGNIDLTDGLSVMEQKTLQYLATKILRLTGQGVEDGSIDGNIGKGSRADINLATGLNIWSKDDITTETIQIIVQKANMLITTKRAELAIESTQKKEEEVLTQEAVDTAISNITAKLEERNALEDMRPTARPENVVESNEEYSVEHALAALDAVKTDREAVRAIQAAVGDQTDGRTGPTTRAEVEANPKAALDALATYIDTTDDAAVKARLQSEKPAAGAAIDTALSEYMEGNPSEMGMRKIVAEFTGDVDSHTRNENAQYISLWLQAHWRENDFVAQRIMEAVMAEWAGHYEQETTELQIRQALVDGSGRFARHLGNFPENFNGSYYKVRQTLQWAEGRSRVENGMENGLSGSASEITQALFGVDGNYLATRVHVVTGQGQDGDADMSVELAWGIQLSNAYYDEESGAIYAVVAKGNGCEGNLVVIPVETFVKPKPTPVVVPRAPRITTPNTRTPEPEDKPEEEPNEPKRVTRTECINGRVAVISYDPENWADTVTTFTDERCEIPKDRDDTPSTQVETAPTGNVADIPDTDVETDPTGSTDGGGNDNTWNLPDNPAPADTGPVSTDDDESTASTSTEDTWAPTR